MKVHCARIKARITEAGEAFSSSSAIVPNPISASWLTRRYAAKMVSYAQGFMLLRAAAKAYSWNLDYGRIALLWRGGCIIRSAFLGKIKEAFDKNPKLVNLMVDPYFAAELGKAQSGWRRAVGAAAANGIPLPAIAQGTRQELNDQLWEAARKGDAVAVKSLLDKGADVNARFRYGATALSYASDKGHTEVVKILLERGADVNVRDTFYQSTPLEWAVSKGHTAIIKALLDKGAEGVDAVLLAGARAMDRRRRAGDAHRANSGRGPPVFRVPAIGRSPSR